MSITMPFETDARRVALLKELRVLGTPPEESFDTLVRCAATATGCSAAVLSLFDGDRVWFKARHGITETHCDLQGSFYSHALTSDDLFVVQNAVEDERFHRHPWVAGPQGLNFYATVPVYVDGVRVGSLCVMNSQTTELSSSGQAVLWHLARLATSLLQSRRHLTQLGHERERMSDFARASSDWMWEVDADFRCTWLSATFEVVTQIPVDQVIGTRLADSPLLDAQGEVIPGLGFLKLLAMQQPFVRVTTLCETPNGPLKLSHSAVPRFDAQHRFSGFRGTARDVSESIRIQNQLAAQDRLLRKLTSQVPGVIFQYHQLPGGRGRYLYISDAVREQLGVEPPGPGREVDFSLPLRLLHSDDKQGFVDSITAASDSLKPSLLEYRVVIEPGRTRWMETRASPERLPDGSTLWHGFTADITERKQTELALRESQDRVEMASEAAGIGILEIDLVHGLVVLDRRACANHGLPDTQAELTSDAWMKAVHPDDQAEVSLALQTAMTSGEALTLRYRARFPDGCTTTLEMLARAVPGTEGRPGGLVGTCRDVSAALISERLQTEKEAAERANRAKSEFLSRVSHELRTPLNGILGFTQLMQLDRAQPLQGDQQRRLDSVLRAGRHLLDLINEVLDLSRIESEEFSLKLQPVNLSAAVQACVNLVQPLADGSSVYLPSAPLPEVWVKADPRALEQVLMNLLSNAIKYNRPHGAVALTTDIHDEKLTLAIRDDGPGLSAKQLADLFQPFNRLGAERSRVEGSGLGLVISRDLIHAMGGRLHVSSSLGQGATFSIVLALSRSGNIADNALNQSRQRVVAYNVAQPKTVLYIEDEPVNAILMQEIFRSQPQWVLHVAIDGAQGLQAAQTLRPDLVLIDMNLPDMNGLALLQQLKRHRLTGQLRCIALSADALPEQISAALMAGFSDYWTKPIDVAAILHQLNECLAD